MGTQLQKMVKNSFTTAKIFKKVNPVQKKRFAMLSVKQNRGNCENT